MLKVMERYRIIYMLELSSLMVTLAKSELVKKYDLSSLRYLGCGGVLLEKEVVEDFKVKFPNMKIGHVNK
ncbi:hypothetical protein AAZV13_01G092200 [Glycine max]